MSRILKEKDCDLQLLARQTIAIIGYGNQGRAHALNLRDSGAKQVIAGLRQDSPSRGRAEEDGLDCRDPGAAAAEADITMLLTPDETHGEVYEQYLQESLREGAALGFAHGFSVRFGQITPRRDIDVIMMAPKGPGHTLRALYEDGLGMITLVGVEQDISGKARDLALSYAAGLGAGRAGILESSFAEECESDLFSEQAVLCGGMPALIKASFELLVEKGYAPEVAYIECLHEVKQIADLLWEGGLAHMDESISNTAEFGGFKAAERIAGPELRAAMEDILANVRSGAFADDFMADVKKGRSYLLKKRDRDRNHPIEEAGRTIRALMPWLRGGRGGKGP